MATEQQQRLVGHVVIEVYGEHAEVCRFIGTRHGELALQPATNAADLEAAALAVVRQKGGGSHPIMGGRYSCPAELVARATWE